MPSRPWFPVDAGAPRQSGSGSQALRRSLRNPARHPRPAGRGADLPRPDRIDGRQAPPPRRAAGGGPRVRRHRGVRARRPADPRLPAHRPARPAGRRRPAAPAGRPGAAHRQDRRPPPGGRPPTSRWCPSAPRCWPAPARSWPRCSSSGARRRGRATWRSPSASSPSWRSSTWVLRFSGILVRILRPSGIEVVTRIAGLLVAAIAVQLLADAIGAFVTEYLHSPH